MKQRLIIIIAVVISVIFINSCRDKDGEMGIDKEEIISEYLPFTQYNIAHWQGGNFGRISSVWMQHLAGVRNQYENIEKYKFERTIVDDSWELIYTYIYYNLNTIINYASELQAPAYFGISKVMLAYTFMLASDAFNDMPYNEANKYFSGGMPEYDSQEVIYETINTLLVESMNDINIAITNPGSIRPGPDNDIIYNGDLTKWYRAARFLRLKATLRISHEDQNYNHALEYINDGGMFTGNNDNLMFYFEVDDEYVNRFYYYDENVRDVRVGSKIVNLLKNSQDPRLPVFIKPNGNYEYIGSEPGELNFAASFISDSIASRNSPMPLATYTEQKFIEAEVFLRTGNQGAADQAFKDAVIASLEQHDVYDENWVNENADIDNVTLEDIITQKYIALFLQPEVWADWRRTGYPQLNAASGNVTQNKIPRRYLYPESENFYNPDNVPQDIEVAQRVWWDIE